MTDAVVVPATPLLLPENGSLRDPVADLRATAEAVLAGWPDLLPAVAPERAGDMKPNHGTGDGDPAHGAVTESTGPVMEGIRS